MKKTPIPRLPKFYPRKEPLKASELNRLVDAINALATRIEEPEVKRKKQQEFLMPFYPRYRYDPETGNGFVSVTSGRIIEWGEGTNVSPQQILEVTNTWQPPDEPLEMPIEIDQQITLKFDIPITNGASIEITEEDPAQVENQVQLKLAVLKQREDTPNGASPLQWAGLDYYAAGSHVYWHEAFKKINVSIVTCEGGNAKTIDFFVDPSYLD